MLDGRRDQVAATFRTGDIAVISDGLASTRPNEVGHLFRYRGVLPEPRYVSPQVVHHDPGTAFGEKFDVCPPQPAACPSHNGDLALQRNSFSHLALRSDSARGSSHGSDAKALGQHGDRWLPLQRRTHVTLATAAQHTDLTSVHRTDEHRAARSHRVQRTRRPADTHGDFHLDAALKPDGQGVHREFPVRSRGRPRDEEEDGCVSATAVVVSAGTAHGSPTAADATEPGVRTRRWMKAAVAAAISVAIAYTVI